jgi:hypothetical protein
MLTVIARELNLRRIAIAILTAAVVWSTGHLLLAVPMLAVAILAGIDAAAEADLERQGLVAKIAAQRREVERLNEIVRRM